MSESEKPPVWRSLSPRKKRLLGISLVIAVIGLVWKAGSAVTGGGDPQMANNSRAAAPAEIVVDSDYARDTSRSDLVSNLSTNDGVKSKKTRAIPIGDSIKNWKPDWSDATVRLGLSFFVAMVVGSVLRSFVKSMAVISIVLGGAYWYMLSQGMVDPLWEPDKGFFVTAKDWVMDQSEGVKVFLKGYLPSAGAASLGFLFGLAK